MKIRYGTRGSKLALLQSRLAISIVKNINKDTEFEETIIKTLGDKVTNAPLFKVGGQGLFIKEIEQALIEKKIDIAIHSLKDLPWQLADGLCLLAVGCEEDPRDCIISRNNVNLNDLPPDSIIGTSSLRRRAQILTLRSDISFVDMRGNIDTRLKKLENNEADAIILACAGLNRLGLDNKITEKFSVNKIVPAVGQGLIAIECRKEDEKQLKTIFETFSNKNAMIRARAERKFLEIMNAGCSTPITAHATINDKNLMLQVFMSDDSLQNSMTNCFHGSINNPEELGKEAASEMLNSMDLLKIKVNRNV